MAALAKTLQRGTGGGPPPPSGPIFTCPLGTALYDAVYFVGVNTLALAFAGIVGQTPPAVGVVSQLLTPTTCRMVAAGPVDGPAILIAGTRYWLSNTAPGKLVSAAPQTKGEYAQRVGDAASASRLWCLVDPTIIRM